MHLSKRRSPFKDKEGLLIRPWNYIDIESTIQYNDRARAWNTIRLKKDVLNVFPQLYERESAFTYKLIYYKTLEALESFIKEIKKYDYPLPILMYFLKLSPSQQ